MLTIYHNKNDFLHADCTTAILPVGAIEQHGSHLLVGTDILLAQRFANQRTYRVAGIRHPLVKHYRPEVIEQYANAYRKAALNYRELLEADSGNSSNMGGGAFFKKSKR
ncbi:MAG: Creatinine amidohydrolase [Paenibacillus sp.]|jgi:hypothetical protein|nr:Creatinine amidohydrolase [Paenibacillus sp.]